MDGEKYGTDLPQRDLTYILKILIFDQQFPREDLVKIWLRLDTWTPAARRLEGQALYGAGLGAAPTVESLGRSLQVLKTRWTAR